MTDTYELDPDFVEQKPKRHTRAPTTNPVPNPVHNPTHELHTSVTEPPKSGVLVSFYEQNKMLIIIAVAIVIVLIVIVVYWYFSKPKEPLHAGPGPLKHDLTRSRIPDNVPPPNLEQIPTQNQQSTQNQKSGIRPITHEDLVTNTDDAEIDRFANPEEPEFEQKTPKKSNKVKAQDDDENKPTDDEDQEAHAKTQNKGDAILDDLDDLESSDS